MVRFTHHPLFSKEHVLESRLLQLYNHFVLRQKSGLKDHMKIKVNTRFFYKNISVINNTGIFVRNETKYYSRRKKSLWHFILVSHWKLWRSTSAFTELTLDSRFTILSLHYNFFYFFSCKHCDHPTNN